MEMSTVITEPAADVVLLGVGVVSGTIAAELTMAGYKVAGIVRGPYWNFTTDFSTTKYDEWGVQWERKFDFPGSLQTNTIRNNANQFALPTRRATFPIQYHSLGFGVGGAAHHYGGAMGRTSNWGFTTASSTASRYGASYLASINPNDDTEDWPLSYTEYEPYYTAWEQNFGLSGDGSGTSGTGGSISGGITGGTALPMSKNYPLPGHPPTPIGTAFQTATEALGYNPFATTSSLASEPYVNPYGVQINGCVYEGWCTGGGCNFVCETGAKGNSAFRSVPAAVKSGKFTLALNSEVTRMDTNSAGLVTDVRYYDASGNIHIQPGTVFFNGLWGYNQVRSMLLSGVGVPYNPTTVTGTVGRGLTYGYLPYTGTTGPGGSIPLGLNSIAGNGGGGYTLFEFMDDGFDHTGLGFIGGAEQSAGGYAGSGPTNVSTAGGVSSGSQGSKYKATLQNRYKSTGSTHIGLGGMAPDLPNTTSMWDLDPHYVDAWGDPNARSTHDWTPNPYLAATYFASSAGNVQFLAILNKMGATGITTGGTTIVAPFSAHTDWWGHHWRGGNRVGKSASTSTFNMWQQCWTAPNLFAAGEVNNATGDTVPSGTHYAGMQSEIASEGIQMYLKSPGLLTSSVTPPSGGLI
jgi:gluconate 2-dehydrogenase alpha chain